MLFPFVLAPFSHFLAALSTPGILPVRASCSNHWAWKVEVCNKLSCGTPREPHLEVCGLREPLAQLLRDSHVRLPICITVTRDDRTISQVSLLQNHHVVSSLCPHHLHAVWESALGCVLALGDYNDVDAPSLKVIHCAFHALHVVEMIFAADFLSKAVANILTVNDPTAQVPLHQQSAMRVFDLLSSPQVVVLILWVQICTQRNCICRSQCADGQAVARFTVVQALENIIAARFL